MKKFVFVRYLDRCQIQRTLLVTGCAAESQKAFTDSDRNIEILDWFEVPENWENFGIGDASTRTVLEVLAPLNDLTDYNRIFDLFSTMFEAGYRLAESKRS